jgi:hypothetical protein
LDEGEKVLRKLTQQVNEIVNQGMKDTRELWETKKKILKYTIKEYKLSKQKL